MLTTDDRSRCDRLLNALADVFSSEGRPGGDAAATALRESVGRSWKQGGRTGDGGEWLTAACSADGASPITDLVADCRGFIRWESWCAEGLAGGVSSRLHTTELVGPDGHVPNSAVRVGLLLAEPDTDYPTSRHAGEETYVVLSGVAQWSLDGGPYRPHPVGVFVHHPSWIGHGRRTDDTPFLGAWRWSGDLDLTLFEVVNDPALVEATS